MLFVFFLSLSPVNAQQNKTKQNKTHTHAQTQHVVLHSNMDWYEDETLRRILNS